MHDVHPSACAYTAIANISRDIYTFMSRAGWLSLKMLAAFLCQGCGWTLLKRAQNKCSVSPAPSTHNQTNVAYVLSRAAVLNYAAVHTDKHKNIRNKNLTLVWFDSGAMFLHIYIFFNWGDHLIKERKTKIAEHVAWQWSHTAALLFCWYGLWNQMCLNCVPLSAK